MTRHAGQRLSICSTPGCGHRFIRKNRYASKTCARCRAAEADARIAERALAKRKCVTVAPPQAVTDPKQSLPPLHWETIINGMMREP